MNIENQYVFNWSMAKGRETFERRTVGLKRWYQSGVMMIGWQYWLFVVGGGAAPVVFTAGADTDFLPFAAAFAGFGRPGGGGGGCGGTTLGRGTAADFFAGGRAWNEKSHVFRRRNERKNNTKLCTILLLLSCQISPPRIRWNSRRSCEPFRKKITDRGRRDVVLRYYSVAARGENHHRETAALALRPHPRDRVGNPSYATYLCTWQPFVVTGGGDGDTVSRRGVGSWT